jgi:hypothetical protein
LMDGTVQSRIDDIVDRLDRARKAELRNPQGLATKVPGLEAELAAAESDADRASVTFTVRAMPGGEYDALELRFPPTEEQWANYRKVAEVSPLMANPPRVDGDALAPSLLAACVAEVDGRPVEWSESDCARLWGTLHEGARADLLEAVYQVNSRRSGRPLFESGSDETPSSTPESPTPPSTESPTQFSQGG